MARKDTFFLRTSIDNGASATYESSDIDISAYTDPARGRVLVVDRGWVTFDTDGNGPILAADVVASGTGQKEMGAQVCSETQTALVAMTNNSLFMKTNLYVGVGTAGLITFFNEISSLNPAETTGGFIIPTDKIHCAAATGDTWNADIRIGFMFEVHTEKLSLSRIQELLVSLTAN
jgi:hypothetical protein